MQKIFQPRCTEHQKKLFHQYLTRYNDGTDKTAHLPMVPPTGNTGGHLLCVINTHILADVEYTDVKLWQAQLLLNTIESLPTENLPLLVCGDFNSTPTSAVYELWRNAHVDPRHEDLRRPDICGLMSNPLSFGHRLRLLSGYEICTGELLLS